MHGFNVVHPGTTRLRHTVATNVSDVFVNAYIRDVMDDDPLRVGAHETGRAVYSLDLMEPPEWEESDAYRRAFSMHRMRHVVEAPLLAGGRPIGSLHFGTGDAATTSAPPTCGWPRRWRTSSRRPSRPSTRASGSRWSATRRARRSTRPGLPSCSATRARASSASTRPRGGSCGTSWTATSGCTGCSASGGDGPSSRRLEVELVTGETATLHADFSPVGEEGALVTVLELRREHPHVSPTVLAALTPREAEVAGLVVDGLADREIADELMLSHHTVSQYVKRIYRKLDVDSRVGLTRLLLGAPPVHR